MIAYNISGNIFWRKRKLIKKLKSENMDLELQKKHLADGLERMITRLRGKDQEIYVLKSIIVAAGKKVVVLNKQVKTQAKKMDTRSLVEKVSQEIDKSSG